MKLYLNMTKPVSIVAKTETPYNVNGNSGITYRIAILCDGDVEKVKCVSGEVYNKINVGASGLLHGVIDIRSGSTSEWKINDFVPQK